MMVLNQSKLFANHAGDLKKLEFLFKLVSEFEYKIDSHTYNEQNIDAQNYMLNIINKS